MTTPQQPGFDPAQNPPPVQDGTVQPGFVPTENNGSFAPAPQKGGFFTSVLGKIISALLVLALVAGGIWLFKNLTGTQDPKVGDCIIAKGNDKDASHKVVKCDSKQDSEVYKVTAIGKAESECPADSDAIYQVTARKSNATTYYCLKKQA